MTTEIFLYYLIRARKEHLMLAMTSLSQLILPVNLSKAWVLFLLASLQCVLCVKLNSLKSSEWSHGFSKNENLTHAEDVSKNQYMHLWFFFLFNADLCLNHDEWEDGKINPAMKSLVPQHMTVTACGTTTAKKPHDTSCTIRIIPQQSERILNFPIRRANVSYIKFNQQNFSSLSKLIRWDTNNLS